MHYDNNDTAGQVTFVSIKEGEDIPRESMTKNEVRAIFHQAINATNHVGGGGREGYRQLLSFVIYSLNADHGDCAVAGVMKELGWEKVSK